MRSKKKPTMKPFKGIGYGIDKMVKSKQKQYGPSRGKKILPTKGTSFVGKTPKKKSKRLGTQL